MNWVDPIKAHAVPSGVALGEQVHAAQGASRANRSVSSEADKCQSGYVVRVHPLTAAHPTVMRGRTIGSRCWTRASSRAIAPPVRRKSRSAQWVYEHAVDFDGLRRFHHNLGYGLMGRRIERSPLRFARYRWVLDRWPLDIDIAESARPRAELSDWVDERSQLPTDAEWGPSWHLGVLPLTDGSTAVSLVASHYVIDGLGFVVTVADALLGNTRDLGYPSPRSRPRLRAVLQDARQTAREAPQVARALVMAAKVVRADDAAGNTG